MNGIQINNQDTTDNPAAHKMFRIQAQKITNRIFKV